MNALAEVAAAGGRVWAEGGKLKYRLPKGRADLLEALRQNKPAIMAELKAKESPSTGERSKPSRTSRVEGPSQDSISEATLSARCREACRGLPVSPADLLTSLNEADKQAMLSGDPDELAILRTAAECMAERAKPALDAKIERAYRWLRGQLAKYPERHRDMLTIDPDADPVLVAVIVRGIGCATLRIEKAKYAGREFELIEVWDRVDVVGNKVQSINPVESVRESDVKQEVGA